VFQQTKTVHALDRAATAMGATFDYAYTADIGRITAHIKQ
jgi:hypothetical protein